MRGNVFRMCLIVLALVLGGLAQPSVAQPETDQAAYDLQIDFFGMIAFARGVEEETAWALLVDADMKDEAKPLPEELPPCVDPVKGYPAKNPEEPFVPNQYMAHHAYLKIRQGSVVGGDLAGQVLNRRLWIKGYDIRIAPGRSFPNNSLALDQLADASKIKKTRPNDESGDADLLQPIDDKLLKPKLAKGILGNNRLAARVLLDKGEVVAEPIEHCDGGEPVLYNFVSRPGGCAGMTPELLSERVSLGAAGVEADKLTLEFLADASEHSLEIAPEEGRIRLEIVNQVWEAVWSDKDDVCEMPEHGQAFRWFYRLAKNPGDCKGKTQHYYWCAADGDFGGTKCPVRGGG